MAEYKMKVKKADGSMEEITLPLAQKYIDMINGKMSIKQLGADFDCNKPIDGNYFGVANDVKNGPDGAGAGVIQVNTWRNGFTFIRFYTMGAYPTIYERIITGYGNNVSEWYKVAHRETTLGVPSDNFIDISSSFTGTITKYTAPANGYINLQMRYTGAITGSYLQYDIKNSSNKEIFNIWHRLTMPDDWVFDMIPISKGQIISMYNQASDKMDVLSVKFIYGKE